MLLQELLRVRREIQDGIDKVVCKKRTQVQAHSDAHDNAERVAGPRLVVEVSCGWQEVGGRVLVIVVVVMHVFE